MTIMNAVMEVAKNNKVQIGVVGTGVVLGVGYLTRNKIAKPIYNKTLKPVVTKVKSKLPHKKAAVVTNTDKTGMVDQK
jgi:hypothetical protein